MFFKMYLFFMAVYHLKTNFIQFLHTSYPAGGIHVIVMGRLVPASSMPCKLKKSYNWNLGQVAKCEIIDNFFLGIGKFYFKQTIEDSYHITFGGSTLNPICCS